VAFVLVLELVLAWAVGVFVPVLIVILVVIFELVAVFVFVVVMVIFIPRFAFVVSGPVRRLLHGGGHGGREEPCVGCGGHSGGGAQREKAALDIQFDLGRHVSRPDGGLVV